MITNATQVSVTTNINGIFYEDDTPITGLFLDLELDNIIVTSI